MKTRPKVSILIPSCGRPSIITAIESVLSQSIAELEVIVLADPACARDFGDRLRDSIRNDRVRIEFPLLSECPVYVPARISMLRNLGIAVAQGAYIAYLDDDNWWSNEHLEFLCAILDSNPSVGVAYSWRVIVDQIGNPVPLETYPWSTRFDNRDQIFEKFVEYGLATRGEPFLRDTVIAENGDELFHVDTSELCVRREVHDQIKFCESFSLRQMIEGQGEDRMICEDLYRNGVHWMCSNKYSLSYRIGGYSNVWHSR